MSVRSAWIPSLVATMAMAQEWTAGPAAPTGLDGRIEHTMVFDSARGVAVMFGGDSTSGTFTTDDTWEYDGVRWRPGPAAPAGLVARHLHGMAYDADRAVAVLFGGRGESATVLNDTWFYDGAAWTSGPAAPAGLTPRYGIEMAYDSRASRLAVVLYGGRQNSGTWFPETWELGAGGWTQGANGPPALGIRMGHRMAFDAARGRIVLFGGFDDNVAQFNDTWHYDGVAWTAGPTAPAGLTPRSSGGLAYDAQRQRTILFGGIEVGATSFTFLDDTWEYDGTTWVAGGAPAAGLTPRSDFAMTYDSARAKVVLFGGTPQLTVLVNDTWEYGAAVAGDILAGEPSVQLSTNRVRVFRGNCTATTVDFQAYGAGRWGTTVASGNVDGGAYGEILTAPGPGEVYGPQVKAFTRDGTPLMKVNFYAYGTLKYGAEVAAGRTDGDTFDEIVTGPGRGPVFGPHVRGWNYDGSTLAAIPAINYFAYFTLRYGVNVATGDVERDLYDEILTAPGPSSAFGAQIRGWNVDGGATTAIAKINFTAFTGAQYGANVAAGDLDRDGYAEIIAGRGPGGNQPAEGAVFNYDGQSVTQVTTFTSFALRYGLEVAAGDANADGREDLIAAPGPDPAADSTVRVSTFNGTTWTPICSFQAFGLGAPGANVAGGRLGY